MLLKLLLLCFVAHSQQQQCTTYNQVTISKWSQTTSPARLQEGYLYTKTLPRLVSVACKATYTLTYDDGKNIPEFIKTEFPSMTITFGSQRAVDIFGLDALYKEYNLTLTA